MKSKLKLNMNFDKLKINYSPFPYIEISDFISKNYSSKLRNEILSYDGFDDKVMVNRKRINKGSKNFEKIISNSDNINQIYEYLNDIETFKKLYSLFDLKKSQWIITENLNNFSKKNFGKQSNSYYEKIIKFFAEKKILKTKINLDIDFSVSGKGYYRGPHRDRETRILNFLLYLNDFDKEDGGDLKIFKYNKDQYSDQVNYPRFPNNELVTETYSAFPKEGKLVVFLSTPNSYHAAGKFLSENKKRIFIYGSYSLNKKVIWIKK